MTELIPFSKYQSFLRLRVQAGERGTMGSENFPLYHFFPMVVELHEFVTLRNTGL